MCDTDQWRLDARPSRYLWETPAERFATTLVILLLPAVILTWAPGVVWDVSITCCWNRPYVFKRAMRLLVTFLYATSHLVYVLLPENDIPRSSAASITNASITSVSAFASMMACLNPDVFSSALACLAALCTRSSASSGDAADQVNLVERASSSDSSRAGEPTGCIEWIDHALGWKPTGREQCYQVILSILSCLGFCAALASDVHVRDSALTYGLGYTTVAVLIVYFLMAMCHHGPQKASRGTQDQDTTSKKRCACICNLPPFTKWSLAVSVLAVSLVTPVLVLRPCASY